MAIVAGLLQIDRMETKRYTVEELAQLSEAILSWAEREREWWRPYLAAVAIQRRIRYSPKDTRK